MNSDQFGKDLGLMHEVVVMGRKTGFGRDEWAKLAHSETLMRATLNFVRSADVAQFPPILAEHDKVVRLAKLMKLVLPYYQTCIACDKSINPQTAADILKRGYAEMGLVLPEEEQRRVENASCHQPFLVLRPLLEEVLGVEPPEGKTTFTEILARKEGYYQLDCVVTSVTSLPNILELMEASRNEGFTLRVNLQFPEK